MNWEALVAIEEIVGAIAVVLTLGYLAVQIPQNTRELRLNTFQSITVRLQVVSREPMPVLSAVFWAEPPG